MNGCAAPRPWTPYVRRVPRGRTVTRWLLLALLLAVTVAMDVTEPEVTDWDAMGFYDAWEVTP